MKLKINAAARLEAAMKLSADHDDSKNEELNKLYRNLRRQDLSININQKHAAWQLYQDNPTPEDIDDLINEVQKSYKLRVAPGATKKENFAVKSPDGLVVQNIGSTVRVFFTK